MPGGHRADGLTHATGQAQTYPRPMPSYVAFLRAINLGATRRFPAADLVAATQAAGGADVATYLATGNVRLTSSRRSASAVARDLEAAYAADRGFAVPTVVLTPAQVREVTALAEEVLAEHGATPGQVLVTLYAEPPDPEAVAAAHAWDGGDRVVVRGRAAYALLAANVHSSTLLRSKEFRALGEGTGRSLAVLRTLAERWA